MFSEDASKCVGSVLLCTESCSTSDSPFIWFAWSCWSFSSEFARLRLLTCLQVLKPACIAALKRIFKLCDTNKDGILDASELNEFQVIFLLLVIRLRFIMDFTAEMFWCPFTSTRGRGYKRDGKGACRRWRAWRWLDRDWLLVSAHYFHPTGTAGNNMDSTTEVWICGGFASDWVLFITQVGVVLSFVLNWNSNFIW